MAADLTEGWGYPLAARKGHFYEQGEIISVCGSWMFTGNRCTLQPHEINESTECASCRRRYAARLAKKEKTHAQT